MRFIEPLVDYSKSYFETAIVDAGYEPRVLYSHMHNDVIDNEMKALIRKSKFVICDLTGNSYGAYYEAGFAHGLEIPVIFLCEKKYFKKEKNFISDKSEGVHFDTAHYPFIRWEVDKGNELKIELANWIEATIGPGLKKR